MRPLLTAITPFSIAPIPSLNGSKVANLALRHKAVAFPIAAPFADLFPGIAFRLSFMA